MRTTPLDPEAVEAAARSLATAERGVALTGAGISVESGIPDFRSKNGLWAQFPPDTYATLSAFKADPERVWRMFRAMHALVTRAGPNPAHEALAEMERWGMIHGVITQNVDGLHQRAGSRSVVEVHGSSYGLHCPNCAWHESHAETPRHDLPLCPRCGATMKPPVVMFEEAMPPQAMRTASAWAAGADTVLVVGTSLQVWPVAGLPTIASANGATLIEVNATPGAMRHLHAVELAGEAGDILPRLLHRAQQIRAAQ